MFELGGFVDLFLAGDDPLSMVFGCVGFRFWDRDGYFCALGAAALQGAAGSARFPTEFAWQLFYGCMVIGLRTPLGRG